MLLQYYVVRVLCCCVIILLQCYVIRVLCRYVIAMLCYYVIRVLHYCNIITEVIYIYADHQYITAFIKQHIQLYYNNLHTII